MDETAGVDESPPNPKVERGFDWLLRNRRTGEITIAQWPNLPLWIFIVTVGLRLVVPVGSTARTIVDGIGVAALAWWALDEVIRGVNPWRRMLGVAGCLFAVSGALALLQ